MVEFAAVSASCIQDPSRTAWLLDVFLLFSVMPLHSQTSVWPSLHRPLDLVSFLCFLMSL